MLDILPAYKQQGSTGMNVLFVDDQASVLNGIASGVRFEELGVKNVRYASGSEQAMEILEEIPIDLMLCDIEMPGEDGMVLNRKVMDKYPSMVRILLTSHADFSYAQESIRLGCFDYIVQPAPYDEIEKCIRKALQFIYERNKRTQLYEIGKRMQTSQMELMDRLVLNLFSDEKSDIDSSMELLALMGYPITRDKNIQILVLKSAQFKKTDTPILEEKTIHREIFETLKQAEISYPIIPVNTVDHRRQFILVLFSALSNDMEPLLDRYRQFFRNLCFARPEDSLQCFIGSVVPFANARGEMRQIQDYISGNTTNDSIVHLRSETELTYAEGFNQLMPDEGRWKMLLEGGQKRLLQNEIEAHLEKIESFSSDNQKAMCDLHQQLTHVFFNYFFDRKTNVNALFGNEYRYTDYMGSFTDADALRTAVNYMLNQVDAVSVKDLPTSDVEKAKNYIVENISDPITVKNVADHVCLNAEYFTKLFKRETGQNIKEFITLTKIEAAKEMLEYSSISVSMVALELGYTNFSHFSQVFKKYEDMSPSEYRIKLSEDAKKAD